MSAPFVADLERAIAELKDLKTPALQIKWRTVFGGEPWLDFAEAERAIAFVTDFPDVIRKAIEQRS